MNITEKYGKPLLFVAAITLSSTAAYCSTWSFITDIIGKLDANPAAIKTLDAPNVKAQNSASSYTAVLEPTADSKFAAVARSVGIDDVTKASNEQISQVSQVAFAYKYVDDIVANLGGAGNLVGRVAKPLASASNANDITRLVVGAGINYQGLNNYLRAYNARFASPRLAHRRLNIQDVWQATYAKVLDDVEIARDANKSLMTDAEIQSFRSRLADNFDQQAGGTFIKKAVDEDFFTGSRLCRSGCSGSSKTLDDVFDELIGACRAN